MQPQDVLSPPNPNTIFMVWNFRTDLDDNTIQNAFQKLCALVIGINNSLTNRFPQQRSSCVLGISHRAWQRLDLPTPMPKELVEFTPIEGQTHTAVATAADLHFHIRAEEKSLAYDVSATLTDALQNVAHCIDELHGFRYWDGRSIIGFVDGTENPHTPEDRQHFALVGDDDPQYRGGSYLFVQKYLHDMTAWRKLPLHEQEKVIGRTKADDIEMSDEDKPSNAHTALANIGGDFKVIRDNMPFGQAGSNAMGTYFIAYGSNFSTVHKMLTNMFIGDPPGNHDRLLDFSRTHSGTLFFVPSVEMLGDFCG